MSKRRLPDFIDGFREYVDPYPSPKLYGTWGGIVTISGALERQVWVHTLGRDAEERLFMSMKLVRGTSWHDLLHPQTDEHRDAESTASVAASLGEIPPR